MEPLNPTTTNKNFSSINNSRTSISSPISHIYRGLLSYSNNESLIGTQKQTSTVVFDTKLIVEDDKKEYSQNSSSTSLGTIKTQRSDISSSVVAESIRNMTPSNIKIRWLKANIEGIAKA